MESLDDVPRAEYALSVYSSEEQSLAVAHLQNAAVDVIGTLSSVIFKFQFWL